MATVAQQPKTDRDPSAPDSQIPRLIIIGAALLVVLGALGVWFLIAESSGPAEVATLERALKALDQSKYAKAHELAEEIRDARSALPDELGGVVYVLGASTAAEASEKVQQERINYYMLAARYLEEARDRGFPQGRKASGLLLLGECLFNGHRYVQARLVLKEALAAGAKPVSQIHLLLSTSHLEGQSPNFKDALAHNTSYLEDKSLTVTSREDGLLQRSEIQFHLGQTDACRATLSAIPKRSKRAAHAIIMRGRILLHEAGQLKNAPASQQSPEHQLQASQRYDEAIKLLRTAMGRTTLGSDAKAQAMYLSGLCYLGKGEFQAAKKQLSKIRDLTIQTPEKLAAMLLEADLLRQHLGQDDTALENYRRARDAAGPPESYSNRWVSLSEFRQRLLGAYHEYLKIKNFQKAIDLSGLLTPMFSEVRTKGLTADAHRQWADALFEEAKRADPSKVTKLRRQGRANLRRAGVIYYRVAKKLVATREYPDYLWRSAENLRRGHDYSNAAKVFRKYLEIESRDRRALALVGLGESLLVTGETEEALVSLNECIDFFPKDAASYRARLLGSRAYLGSGEVAKAKSLLHSNLHETTLTPAAAEWRDSLFAMGRLLYVEGSDRQAMSKTQRISGQLAESTKSTESAVTFFRDAIKQLSQAVARYPNDSRLNSARYMIAESHRQSAMLPKQKLENTEITTTRKGLIKSMNKDLAESIRHLVKVQTSLNERQETTPLSVHEKLLLRNTYFAQGIAQFDLGKYEEAIKTYSTATNRYLNDPVVLDAFVQIAHCYRKMNEPDKARGIMQQAKVAIERIPPDAQFDQATPYTREQWQQMIEWQINL